MERATPSTDKSKPVYFPQELWDYLATQVKDPASLLRECSGLESELIEAWYLGLECKLKDVIETWRQGERS